MSNKFLVVIDMQNDFVTGSLGTAEAQQIVPSVVKKVENFEGTVIFTLDTHDENYMTTQEGSMLPVKHCLYKTHGWQIIDELEKISLEKKCLYHEKQSFGSSKLAQDLKAIHDVTPITEIELIGICTDICVVSIALILKVYLPEVLISVDESCCAGTTPQNHDAAIQTMRNCQIIVKNGE